MALEIPPYITQCQSRVNQKLEQILSPRPSLYGTINQAAYQQLWQALRYCVMNGGKRLRPALFYAGLDALADSTSSPPAPKACDAVASALELIHSYSLCHDDLPAMDDDDLRRGQASCHVAFDEPTAILAGDALQSLAFQTLSSATELPAGVRLELIDELSAAAGAQGMVGGQALDLAVMDYSKQEDIDIAYIETMHRLKTGALIRASVRMAAICCQASAGQRTALDTFATAAGLAFQVHDDILDVEMDTATLGKTQGADVAKDKATYPALLGLDAAKNTAQSLLNEAGQALEPLGSQAEALQNLAIYIVERHH